MESGLRAETQCCRIVHTGYSIATAKRADPSAAFIKLRFHAQNEHSVPGGPSMSRALTSAS